MREVLVDGTSDSAERLRAALLDALAGGQAVLPLDPRSARTEAMVDALEPRRPVEQGTAAIIATSGSTGAPKGVLLSPEALLSSARATHDRIGGPGAWLLATPANYIGGLQVLVRSAVAGTTPTLLDISAGFDPAAFAEAATRLFARPGPHYTALVPTQLAKVLDSGGDAVRAATGFAVIVLGGARLDTNLRARAESAGIRLAPAYGMSETASGCVYDGRPLDGVRVRIGAGDRIELAGSVLANGYRLNPEETAKSFVDGWFLTSDIGTIDERGRLEVLGRADDLINTGGVKISPTAVENALLAHPHVHQACVIGVTDPHWGELVAAVVVPSVPAPSVAELRELVRSTLNSAAVPKKVAFNGALPLTGPGKIDRAAVRELIAQLD